MDLALRGPLLNLCEVLLPRRATTPCAPDGGPYGRASALGAPLCLEVGWFECVPLGALWMRTLWTQ